MNHSPVGRHLAAMIVPFKESMEIDEDALRTLARRMLRLPGIDGLVANANAGEVDALTEAERLRVFEIVRDEAHAAGKKAVAAVVPVPYTNEVAARTARQMENHGADSLLLLGSTAFSRGVDAVPEVAGKYAQDVAGAVRIPVTYFMAGPLSGINYTPETVRQICSVDNVVAIKDTMWTPQGFEANLNALRKLGRGTVVLSGNDNCLLQNFVSGADGTLLVLHLVIGAQILDMYESVQANDLRAAQVIHEATSELTRLLFARPMLKMSSRIKYALQAMGVIPHHSTRSPMPGPTPDEMKAISAQLTALKLA
jgi:4-hydroxy-tetrahydrodipicolinate synthase